MEHEKIQEYIFQAVQAGKQETSNLVADLKEVITTAVREEVKITVNGKIDKVQKAQEDTKIHLLKQDVETASIKTDIGDVKNEQIRVGNELKKLKTETDPIVEAKKTLISVVGFVLKLGALCAAIYAIFKLFTLR